MSQYATPDQVELALELPAGSLSPIAWLVMQEEAQGVEREAICRNLGVDNPALEALIDSTTGKTGQESADTWQQGVIAIRAVTIVNQQNIGSGWDAIEALAVDKIARSLSAIKGPVDMDRLMAIATVANKAIRRNAGESSSGGGARGMKGATPGVTLELNSGQLGKITLNLSPAIQEQLARPNRVIDAVRNRDAEKTNTDKLEMLNLRDTRELVENQEKAALIDSRPIKPGNTRYYPENRASKKIDPAKLTAKELDIDLTNAIITIESPNG